MERYFENGVVNVKKLVTLAGRASIFASIYKLSKNCMDIYSEKSIRNSMVAFAVANIAEKGIYEFYHTFWHQLCEVKQEEEKGEKEVTKDTKSSDYLVLTNVNDEPLKLIIEAKTMASYRTLMDMITKRLNNYGCVTLYDILDHIQDLPELEEDKQKIQMVYWTKCPKDEGINLQAYAEPDGRVIVIFGTPNSDKEEKIENKEAAPFYKLLTNPRKRPVEIVIRCESWHNWMQLRKFILNQFDHYGKVTLLGILCYIGYQKEKPFDKDTLYKKVYWEPNGNKEDDYIPVETTTLSDGAVIVQFFAPSAVDGKEKDPCTLVFGDQEHSTLVTLAYVKLYDEFSEKVKEILVRDGHITMLDLANLFDKKQGTFPDSYKNLGWTSVDDWEESWEKDGSIILKLPFCKEVLPYDLEQKEVKEVNLCEVPQHNEG